MKIVITYSLVLFASTAFGQTKGAKEWTLDLSRYGLIKTGCARYPGHVEFLDDEHLAVIAPVSGDCKSYLGKPIETRITEIDLQGTKLADIRRADVAELTAGPTGFVSLCTGGRVELLARNLQPAQSIAVSGCYFGPGLSPSRTAIAIRGPGNSQVRLYRGSSSGPIAEITTSKGQAVPAVADDSFLVCTEDEGHCDIADSQGTTRRFPTPQLSGAAGYYIVGLVTSDKLLLASFDGKHLYAETQSGTKLVMGDVARIRPPFINGSHAQMSATEPRRILYQVDGCPLGDFDDCYGVVFHRFAVFDSQSSTMLFRHKFRAGSDLKISPNGKLVVEQSGPIVHFFQLP